MHRKLLITSIILPLFFVFTIGAYFLIKTNPLTLASTYHTKSAPSPEPQTLNQELITPAASPSASPSPEPKTNNYELSTNTSPTPPTPSPTPTPIPQNCTRLPILMYHHVQDLTTAKTEGHASLTVDTATFRSQMQYLRTKGYQTVTSADLIAFFTSSSPLPPKSILITFDDGYDNFATDAFPILLEFGFKSTVFLPTGLMDNPGYLSWNTVKDLSGSGLVHFANHTWSHHAAVGDPNVEKTEITTADTQLTDHSLNQPKVFAYPYGTTSKAATDALTSLGYQLAFTTRSGTLQCKSTPFGLQRIRIGNTTLTSYGL